MHQVTAPKRAKNGKSGGRKAELLQIAAGVFARKGFANATVRDISEEAGILSGSLYHHFESKDAILEDLVVNLYDGMEAGYQEVIERNLPADEAIVELHARGYGYLDTFNDAIRVFSNDLAYISHIPRFGFLVERNSRIESMWTGVLQSGIDAGLFRPDLDTQFTYRIMMGSLVSAVRWFDPHGPITAEQIGRRSGELFLGGLRAS